MAVTIGGRRYAPVATSTFEHDVHIMGLIRRSGLDVIVKHERESATEFTDRVLSEVMLSGALFPLLSSLLIPEGEAWSIETARNTEAAFRAVTTDADKAVLRGEVASLMADFFVKGIASVVISRSSSTPRANETVAENGKAAIPSEEASPSGNGTTSSG